MLACQEPAENAQLALVPVEPAQPEAVELKKRGAGKAVHCAIDGASSKDHDHVECRNVG